MLEIRAVSKTFNPGTPNEMRALQAIDLTVNDGAFVVIIGTNGSGKSTLLNAVAGSFYVDSGSIALAGADIHKWPEHQRAELIGRVFQNPFSGTAASMSIAENLALAAYRGKPRRLGWPLRQYLLRQMRDRVSQLNMGLEDRLKNPIGSLSGGQRQALTLLMATWLRPELLLLDEHTAALDPKSADQVIALTDTIVRRDKLTTREEADSRRCPAGTFRRGSARRIARRERRRNAAPRVRLIREARQNIAPVEANRLGALSLRIERSLHFDCVQLMCQPLGNTVLVR